MSLKELKLNSRGEAQLALWLPAQAVRKVYEEHQALVKKAEVNGEIKPKFREFFYNKYLKNK